MLEVVLVSIALALVFGWNNSSIAVGALTGVRLLTYRRASLLVASAMLLGVVAEGWKMKPSLLLSGAPSGEAAATALAVSTALMLGANIAAIPVSLSNIATAAYVGAAYSAGQQISIDFLTRVIVAWVAAPLIVLAATSLLYGAVRRLARNVSLATMDAFNRLSVYAVVFYVSYALAANNVSFILALAREAGAYSGLLPLALALACSLGVMLVGRGIMGVMAESLVILSPQKLLTGLFTAATMLWLFTQLSIPVALTQNMLGGFLGAALTTRIALVKAATLRKLIASWTLTTLAGLALAYAYALLL